MVLVMFLFQNRERSNILAHNFSFSIGKKQSSFEENEQDMNWIEALFAGQAYLSSAKMKHKNDCC